ncbi:MAG: hypothetical protein ABW321_11235 [Polyangiales bacterium]
MRWSRSSLLVFAAALLASLSIHLPVYEVLGVLARAFDRDKESAAKEPNSQVEFEINDPVPDADNSEPTETPEREREAQAEKRKPPEQKPEKQAKTETKKPPTPQPTVPVKPQPAPVVPPPPEVQKQIENKLAVTQKTDDPNVHPP